MTLTRLELDNLPCMEPGCNHRDHSEMFLNQRCHWKAGAHVAMMGDLIHVHCAVCEQFIAEVKVRDSALMVGIRTKGQSIIVLCPQCGDDAPCIVSYSKGILHIKCKLCKSPLAWGDVADAEPSARRKNFLRRN